MSKAVEQVFDRSRKIVGVERSDATAFKADNNARCAFFFSLCCAAQCWRLVTLSDGVRYKTVSFKQGFAGIGEKFFEVLR